MPHELNLDQLIVLSDRLAKTKSLKNQAISFYYSLMFLATRAIEQLRQPRVKLLPNSDVLNFGCGLHFADAVNSDLFQLHRYIKRKPRPDIYLSGTYVPSSLEGGFGTIICEHVLEHVLPTSGLHILKTLHAMLRPGGIIQISVPSPIRFIDCSAETPYFDAIKLNDATYNYGHQFMHNNQSLAVLLENSGFSDIQTNSYETSPCRTYLSATRSDSSIYILGTKKS